MLSQHGVLLCVRREAKEECGLYPFLFVCIKKTLTSPLFFATQFRILTSGRTINLTELNTALITLLHLKNDIQWKQS